MGDAEMSSGDDEWSWDETLYSGSARHYVVGRMEYPTVVADTLRKALKLDGTQSLLDLGCGPSSLTVLLAADFKKCVGVDPDADMISEAVKRTKESSIGNVQFVRCRAEEIADDFGNFDVVTAAQSFHWMDQATVAANVRQMLNVGGAFVHFGATTHRGVETDEVFPLPQPPHDEIQSLVNEFLGPVRRAGIGTLPNGIRSDENEVLRLAGFSGPEIFDVGGGGIVERTVEQVTASVFSLSSSAPHLFGDRLAEFQSRLHELLDKRSLDGVFNERRREMRISIWRAGDR